MRKYRIKCTVIPEDNSCSCCWCYKKKRKENYSLAPDSNPSLLFHLMRQKVFTGKCCFPSNNVFDSAAPLCMICLTFNVCDSVPLTK